jgi:hypothetical protein
MTDCLMETQDKRLLLKDGLKSAMTTYRIKFKVADKMEMLCKSVVTRMPSISLSQDVQVIEDEDDGGEGGEGSGGLSGEGEEAGTFSNIAAKADSVDVSGGREDESTGVDGGRAGSSSISKTCRASAREGDGREDIQEEEEGGEGQKGGQNPLSVDKNVSWDNLGGNSQHAQGAERQDLDEGGDLSSQGEGSMPPFQAADELREAMAVLKKSDHLGDWDGGQGEGEGEDVREGQAGHRPEASESQEERSSNKRKITSPGETQKRRRSEAGVEKGVSAAVEDENVLTPSVAHARDSGGASAAQQAQGPHDAVLGASPAAAAAAYPAVLRFQQSSGTPVLDLPESIPLDPGTEYVVGRADEEGRSLIPLHSASQEGMVSRKHAFISFSTQEGAWHVVDNNSTNGMILNGQRVSQALLKDGMCVCACMRMCVLVGQSYHSSTELEERRRCDHLRRRQIHRAQRHSFQQSYKEHLQFHLSAGVTPDTLRRPCPKERKRMF